MAKGIPGKGLVQAQDVPYNHFNNLSKEIKFLAEIAVINTVAFITQDQAGKNKQTN